MIKNKLTTIKMNKFKFFSVALLASAFASQAQDINQAKKAVMKSNLSSEAKRKRLDEIQMSQVRIARRALRKENIR